MSTKTTADKKTLEHPYNSVNPFVSEIIEYVSEKKHRKVVGHSWQDVVDTPTGNVNKQKVLILGEQKVVDTQQYTKVYMGEMQRFFGLSKKAINLLEYIMENIKYGNDRICLYYPDIKEKLGMIKSTMHTCINKMLEVGMLARANTPGCYYINPAVMFKGDRITLVKEWVRDHTPSQIELDNIQEGVTEEEIEELYRDK